MHAKKRQEIDTTLKIPIVNNMALAFQKLANQADEHQMEYLQKVSNLLDQVLKIEPKNEKALMRKCRVLVDIGGKENFQQCESLLKILNEVAFDSAKSQAVYMEIRKIQENMEEKKSGVKKAPPTAKKPPKKNGFDKEKAKENDWYYQRKLFEKELDLKQK